MSIADYRSARELIERHGGGRFAGARDDELVAAAEHALGLTFPASYREFVSEFGAGQVAGEEFFGVTTDEFLDSSIPNGVWLTLRERQDSGLPGDLILVHETGDGAYHAVDSHDAVVQWEPGPGGERHQVAASFGEFLRRTVQAALG